MRQKKWTLIFVFVFIMVASYKPAMGQMKRVYKFTNVKIPFCLKHGDTTIKNGSYHLEFLRNRNQGLYYLRIFKGRKVLCLVPGEQIKYESVGFRKLHDPRIPKNPRLQFKRDPAHHQVNFIFESGRDTRLYPFIKCRFCFDCVE